MKTELKASDLRIGNYVLDEDNNIRKVATISWLGLYKINGHCIIECKPIQLTEEWLIKMGFEKWDRVIVNEYEEYDRYVLYNYIDGTSNYEVHIIHSNYGGDAHIEMMYSIDNDERQYVSNTKYVHNLQNHYYLVTGEELTIKND